MRYEQIEKLEGEKFRRLTGVKQTTFNKMVEILDEDILTLPRKSREKVKTFLKKNKMFFQRGTICQIEGNTQQNLN